MTTNQYIKRAVSILNTGGLVAFPTETVYGLGADARNDAALAKIYAVKERPASHPLIVHLADISQMQDWASVITEEALLLARTFWPGPLTMLLPKKAHVSEVVSGGQKTIGLRIPRHPIAQSLLQAFGDGIAAPSANKFTHVSPTYAKAVYEELGDQVDLILEGGDCEVGLESTIIDMTSDAPVILRPGMIGAEAIASVLGMSLTGCSNQRVPGAHPLHYAPNTTTILLAADQIAKQRREGDTVLTIKNLGETPELYAHKLYKALRELDNQQFARIIVEDVPLTPEWEAVRDRLSKACMRKL